MEYENEKKSFFDKNGRFQRGVDKIANAWAEQPLVVIASFSMAAVTASKLIDSISAVQGRRAYARQTKYRAKQKK